MLYVYDIQWVIKLTGATGRFHQLDGPECSVKRPQYHFPRTFVSLKFAIYLHYSRIGDIRWKIVDSLRQWHSFYIDLYPVFIR